MAKKVFLTGGTGFVGREIVRQLLAAGYEVKCLVRPGSENNLPALQNLELCPGDATNSVLLEGMIQGCDAVVNLIGIIREFPSKGITFEKLNFQTALNLVRAAESQGVKRFIHMSANGSKRNSGSGYFETKFRAGKAVMDSSLKWTVFKPSVIFGKEDAFTNLLADIVRMAPVVPVIGDGQYRLAPVAVEDVAACFIGAVEQEETVGKIFPLCGPDEITYDQLVDIIASVLNRKRPVKMHISSCFIKPIATLLESFPQFPVTREQMKMLVAGNTCADKKWMEVFHIQAKAFNKENLGYLKTPKTRN